MNNEFLKALEAESVCPRVTSVVTRHLVRAEMGMKKYGVNAARTDLNVGQWLQHLQDELMDAAIYVESLKQDYKELEAFRQQQAR